MRQIFLTMTLLVTVMGSAFAQNDSIKMTSPSEGDYYEGLTRPLTFDRMIPPYALEVTFNKTVHVIFPSAIRYVDLGSADLLAGKADGTENVLRVKAALRDFSRESNLSVICEDGSYYTFNVKYADEPRKLSVEMKDFLHDGEAVNRPNNAMEVYLKELGSESPLLVNLIMRSIYKQDKREVKHIGCKRFGVQFTLRGIYSHNDLLYFHFQLKNSSTVSFATDYFQFKIVDKKLAKRTAIQEQVVEPLRALNYFTQVDGKSVERVVFALPKFTIPDDKQLVVELAEQHGGRHQSLVVENTDIVRASVINELKIVE
ncbi:MAG: conjugative transposon protein TraN [Bacteroidales bacterium]